MAHGKVLTRLIFRQLVPSVCKLLVHKKLFLGAFRKANSAIILVFLCAKDFNYLRYLRGLVMNKLHRIEVGIATNEGLKNSIHSDLGFTQVEKVKLLNVYTIEVGATELSSEDLKLLGQELFSDPIIEKFSINSPLASPFPGMVIEVGFKPGVTDNIGRSATIGIKDTLSKEVKNVYSSTQYLIYGALDEEIAESIAKDLLANALIERWSIVPGASFEGIEASAPEVILTQEPKAIEVKLDSLSDEELLALSEKGTLALNLEEMKAIQKYFLEKGEQRQQKGLPANPMDIELECLAQTWSEHCKHKIFNALIDYEEDGKQEQVDSIFKTYIKGSTEAIGKDYLVSVFKDNAGIISFTEDHNLVMKVETHNSPTALDPYGGALTGIVGCNRDPAGTGLGCKLIFNTDVFCFASPFYDGEIPPRLFHPKRVLKGVHKGIIDGGNQSGIPTVNGSLYFDERFLGKPLVFCGTGGIAPKTINGQPSHVKTVRPGYLVVMVGGRIGADGIHGATFSSLEINENSPSTAVQIGAPIVQKEMLDFIMEARDQGLYTSITDNGAGGLSSSVGEMGEEIGARLDLDKAPLKYPGLMPWEILVSEAQERMTLAVPPEKIDEFLELAKMRDVEATIVGEFNESNCFQFYYNDRLIGEIEMEFLHHGVPQLQLKGSFTSKTEQNPQLDKVPSDGYGDLLKTMLKRLNICSKEYIVRRYDHEVQGGSIIKPFMGKYHDGPSDAGVVKPIYDRWEGVAVSHGICSRYSDIDAYHMVGNAIDEAIRNAVAVGADPDYMAGLDNFCWAMGFGQEDAEKYVGMLVRANKALYDYCTAFGLPCISGKDSMKNDYRIGEVKVSVPPTMLYSLIGKIPDVRNTISMDAKAEGDLVYILGQTKIELGGSEYLDQHGVDADSVPQVDAEIAMVRYRQLFKAITAGVVQSCHDLSDGGLGVAAAEVAFAGDLGLDLDLTQVPLQVAEEKEKRDDYVLFSESASRFLVTIRAADKEAFENYMKDTIFAEIGQVTSAELVIRGLDGETIIKERVADLKEAWQSTMRW